MQISGYQIEREIGSGQTGTVYLATHQNQKVALKVLSPETTGVPKFKERFRREVPIVSQLNHKSIVRIYDAGVSESRAYLSLEYLGEDTLQKRLGSKMPLDWVCTVVSTIGEALVSAHARGVYHRDLRPQNIFFRKNATPVVSDFCVGRFIHRRDLARNPSGMLRILRYMSPEQVNKGVVGPRTELYAIGALFYEMLTGVPAFKNFTDAMNMMSPVPRLSADLSRFQDILNKTLAKNPEQRYENMRQFVTALQLKMQPAGRTASAAATAASPEVSVEPFPTLQTDFPSEQPASATEMPMPSALQNDMDMDFKTQLPLSARGGQQQPKPVAARPVPASSVAPSVQARHEPQKAYSFDESVSEPYTPQPVLDIVPNRSMPKQSQPDPFTKSGQRQKWQPDQPMGWHIKRLFSRQWLDSVNLPSWPYRKIGMITGGITVLFVFVYVFSWLFISDSPQQAPSSLPLAVNGITPAKPLPPRAVTDVAEETAAAGQQAVSTAVATAGKTPASVAVDPAPEEKPDFIKQYLDMAARQIKDQQFTMPPGDNAYESYQKVIAKVPNHPEAKEGLARVSNLLLRRATEDKNRGSVKKSLAIVTRGLQLFPGHTGLEKLRVDLETPNVPVQPVAAPLNAEPVSPLATTTATADKPASGAAPLSGKPAPAKPAAQNKRAVDTALIAPGTIATMPDVVVVDDAAGSALEPVILERVNSLLLEAGQQFAAKKMTEPTGRSAMDLYLEVLKLDTNNFEAKAGLKKIGRYFEKQAVKLKGQGALYLSLKTAKEGLKAVPNHQGLLALRNELQFKMNDRIKARNTDNQRQKIPQLLAKAENQLRQNKLINPGWDNAFDTYKEILEIDNNNKEAMKGLMNIAKHFEKLARQAQRKGEYEKSLNFVERGLEVAPEYEALEALRETIYSQMDQ